jgi:hypothetical protein
MVSIGRNRPNNGFLKMVRINLTRESFFAISVWRCSRGLPPLRRTGMLLIELEFLLQELREARDNPILFPKGKWATIQVLEGDCFLAAESNEIEGE